MAERTEAAMRRRQRRLCSWWRHEQLSVTAAFATAHHHSYDRKEKTKVVECEEREEVEHEKNDTLQGQCPPPPGSRLAPLPEVAAPQKSTVARCPVGGGLSLATPLLAGRAAEGIDPSFLRFLAASALAARWGLFRSPHR